MTQRFFRPLHTDEQRPNWIGNFIAKFIIPKNLIIDWILTFKWVSVFTCFRFSKTQQTLFFFVVSFKNGATETLKTLCKSIGIQSVLRVFCFINISIKLPKNLLHKNPKMRQICRLLICVWCYIRFCWNHFFTIWMIHVDIM